MTITDNIANELGSSPENAETLRQSIGLQPQHQEPNSPLGCNTLATDNFEGQDAERRKPPGGLLALDRKKMEEQRLARQANKRPRPIPDNYVEGLHASKKHSTPTPYKAPRQVFPSMFPDGTVKRTWARGYTRTGDDITIEEVLQKDELVLAMLSSYQWDEDWLLTKVNSASTKLLLVVYAADDRQRYAMQSNAPPEVKFCFPPMNGIGSMHSKLQILKFSHYLRIVVPTGNLVPYDWGETGVLENMVFLIDLPRLDKAAQHRPTRFSHELDLFLRAMGIDAKMVDSLSSYDFSKTASLGFVHSRPGGYMDESLKHVGYCGLSATVTSLGLATTQPIEVDLVCSSIGSLKYNLPEALYRACQGDDGVRLCHERAPREAGQTFSAPPQLLKDRFRIYFPTHQTVVNTRGGKAAAGTICLQEKWWRSPGFPRDLLRDCVNTRGGLLLHSKVMFVRFIPTGIRADEQVCWTGWAYVGSANLSESAWGRVVKDKKSGKAKISCRNWECGVVLPASHSGKEINELHVFHGKMPIPIRVPGRPYRPEEEPWLFENWR